MDCFGKVDVNDGRSPAHMDLFVYYCNIEDKTSLLTLSHSFVLSCDLKTSLILDTIRNNGNLVDILSKNIVILHYVMVLS